MAIANIHEAKSQLSKLVDQAMNSEKVIIAKASRPMVRPLPIDSDSAPRHGELWKG
jgi:prevent-host-death family protein